MHTVLMYMKRFNRIQVGKGYALKYLLDQISLSDNLEDYDGFFIFDADNLLDENYIAEMNKTFNDGYDAVTSYRNSKTLVTTGFPTVMVSGSYMKRNF